MAEIYTVGHSNHEAGAFLALLKQHGIELLADVRSSPYSRYVPQANREVLARAVEQASIGYRWLGDRLGGKPEGAIVDYDKMRASPAFQQGLTELLALAQQQRTAIMCSEGDYQKCHRYKLITPAVADHGVHVLHILPDGSLVDQEKEPKQLALF